MGRERFDSVAARVTGRIQSALAKERERREERRLSHEQGHVGGFYPEGREQEIVTFPQARECFDTRSFSVTQSPVAGYLTPEAKLRRQLAEAYAPSVTHKEDPRLKGD